MRNTPDTDDDVTLQITQPYPGWPAPRQPSGPAGPVAVDTEAAGNVTPVSAPEQRWAVEVRASDLTHRTTGQESTTDRHLAHRVSVTQCGALVLWDDDRPGNPVQGYAPGTWLQFYLDPED